MTTETKPDARALDAYLVAAAKVRDHKAMRLLVQRWHPRLVAHGWRLTGDQETARDAVQTAWGDILRGIGKLRDDRAFPAWAFRIVSRACASEIRMTVRQKDLKKALDAEPQNHMSEPVEPSDKDKLQAAIRSLPPGERAAIALYHFEEMRVAEVAVALAIPVGTVKTRLMHARRKLRAVLEPEDQGENA